MVFLYFANTVRIHAFPVCNDIDNYKNGHFLPTMCSVSKRIITTLCLLNLSDAYSSYLHCTPPPAEARLVSGELIGSSCSAGCRFPVL